jgi:hypothetical protein
MTHQTSDEAPGQAPGLPPAADGTARTVARRGALKAGAAAAAGVVGGVAVWTSAADAAAPTGTIPVFDITHYGAVGSGSTADAATNLTAIIAATTALRANGGGILYVPEGHYYTNVSNQVVNGTTYGAVAILCHENTTVLFEPGAVLQIAPGFAQYTLIRIQKVTAGTGEPVPNVAILNATLVGDRPLLTYPTGTGTQGFCVLADQAQNLLLRDCLARDARGDSYRLNTAMSSRVRVVNCTSETAGNDGLRVRQVDDLYVTGCRFAGSVGGLQPTGTDIEPHGGSSEESFDVRLVGNQYEGNAQGGVVVTSNRPVHRCAIVGNTLVGNTTYGVNNGGIRTAIFGNVAVSNTNYGIQVNNSGAVVVANSTADNGPDGIGSNGTSIDGIVVVGNRAEDGIKPLLADPVLSLLTDNWV